MTASILNLGPYRYRPTRQLDETRMSTLWLASEVTRDSTASPGNLVIIKIARMSDTQYSLTNQRAIENEEKWLGKLEHPNIIRLRTVAEREASRQPIFRARSDLPGNPWFLVTDYLPGGDLQSLLNERQKLPASLALDIAEQLSSALAYLHNRRCIHCDIKPRNVLFHERPAGYELTEATRPILIDFGIAKNPSDGPQLASGTPRWITPELHAALRVGRKIEVDPSWDVYAAGLVLYTMITGRKPELDNPGSHSWTPLTLEDLAGDPTVVQAKPLVEGLNGLIAGATADRIADRIQARQLADGVRDLQQYICKPGLPAVNERRRQPSRAGKSFWLAGAGIAVASILAGLLLFMNSSERGESPPPATLPPIAVISQSEPDEVVLAPSSTPTSRATRAPTSTPLNTSTPTRTHTPTPRPTVTPRPSATLRPSTPKVTIEPAQSVVARAASATPVMAIPTVVTSTPVKGTSTPMFTSTPRPRPTTQVTPTQTARVEATAGAASAMTVSLREPANNTNIEFNTQMTFRWEPDRPLQGKECFEVVFWQGPRAGALSGYGIEGAGAATSASRTFNDAYEADSDWLSPGSTYSWGVLLIADCQAYKTTTRTLVSDVRTITYRK